MIRDHALLGVGLNNSTGEAQRYGRYSYSLIDVSNRTAETPIHSFPVTLLVETGIVGFLLYAAFFATVAATAWRLARPPVDPDDACSALAFLVGMVGLALAVMTNPLFDDGVQTFLWLYAGAIVAIAHRVTEPSPVLESPFRPALAT
jgi:O-antigen ligase